MNIKTITQGGIAVLAAISFALTACGEKKEGKDSDGDTPKDVVPGTLSATRTDALTMIRELGGIIQGGDSPDEMIQIQLKGKNITDEVWRHLKDLTNLTELTLDETQVTDIGLRQLKKLTKLKELSLSGTKITDDGLQNLKGLTSLTTLNLSGTPITGNGLTHLKDLKGLTTLTLSDTRITDSELVHLKELANLTTLSICGTKITDAGLKHFKGSTRLKKISLGNLQITKEGVAKLKEALSDCKVNVVQTARTSSRASEQSGSSGRRRYTPPSPKQISTVSLSSTQLAALTVIKELGGSLLVVDSHPGMIHAQLKGKLCTDAVWPHLKEFTDLRELTLDGTQVTDLGLRQLKELAKPTGLTLRSNEHITDAGLVHLEDLNTLQKLSLTSSRGTISDSALKHLKGLSKLKELSLSGTKVTDDGLQNLKGLRNLESLQLKNTPISGNGLTHLKDLKSLTSLSLINTEVTDEKLVHLKELTSLTTLFITSPKITDDGLEHFKGLTHLKKLVLDNGKITKGAVAKLKEALPDCDVFCPQLLAKQLQGFRGNPRTVPPSRIRPPGTSKVPRPPNSSRATPGAPQKKKILAAPLLTGPTRISTNTLVDESTIVNTGAALISAANFGEVAVTVNGLLHGSKTGAGMNLTSNSRFEGAHRGNHLSAPLDTLFRGIAGAPSIKLDISGLKIGTKYLFQAYWEDNAGQTMNVTMEDDALNGITDQRNGVVISYTFTAGDDTLNTSFTRVDGSDNTWLSGYSLQELTPSNPALAATTPPDNALEALNTANLVSTFNMTVQAGTGNISIYKSDDTLVEVIDVNDTTAPGTVTFSSANVTIDPTSSLEDGVGYFIRIDNTAITNVFGSPFAGIADKTGWNFTAKSLDGLSGELGVLNLSANNGINPSTGKLWKSGDTYRLFFITSQMTTAESADIATYNEFVQEVANRSSLNLGGAIWKVVGSTAAVDARTNTTTDPAVNGTGEAFFLLDGSTVLATGYTDLWDGLAAKPNINEIAQPYFRQTRPFTGSFANGTAKAGGLELGGTATKAGTGINDQLGIGWLNSFNNLRTDLWPLFAMSNPLKIR